MTQKQGEGCGVAVQETLVAHGTNFSVAEKPGESEGTELILNQIGIVIFAAEQSASPSVAAAQACAVNDPGLVFFARRGEQHFQIVCGRASVAPLELDRLAGSGESAHGDAPGIRIGTEEVPDEEITALKILEVFVDDQADKQVAPGFFCSVRFRALNVSIKTS